MLLWFGDTSEWKSQNLLPKLAHYTLKSVCQSWQSEDGQVTQGNAIKQSEDGQSEDKVTKWRWSNPPKAKTFEEFSLVGDQCKALGATALQLDEPIVCII